MTDKLLALTIPGFKNPIGLPSQINNITNVAKNAPYGANIIWWAITMAYAFGTVTALAFMLYGGWKWITSQGDPKNLETAHNVLIYASVGLGLIFLSTFFVNVAAYFLCVPLLGWIPTACH